MFYNIFLPFVIDCNSYWSKKKKNKNGDRWSLFSLHILQSSFNSESNGTSRSYIWFDGYPNHPMLAYMKEVDKSIYKRLQSTFFRGYMNINALT